MSGMMERACRFGPLLSKMSLFLKYCSGLNVALFPILCGKFTWEILAEPTRCVWQVGSLKRAIVLNGGSGSTYPVVEV